MSADELTPEQARELADSIMGRGRPRTTRDVIEAVAAEHANDEAGELQRLGGTGWPEPEPEAEELTGGASNVNDDTGGIGAGPRYDGT
jgi:hypothetical protein